MELQDLIIKYNKIFEKKLDIFDFLYQLKYNIKFNSSITPEELYLLINDIYNDNSPLYQNTTYSGINQYNGVENINDFIDEVIHDYENDDEYHLVVYTDNIHEVVETESNLRNMIIEIRKDDSFEHLKELVDDMIYNDNEKIIHILWPLSDENINMQEVYQLFTNKIIPHNVILPLKYVHKSYISTYFYNAERDQYYKIKDFRNEIVVCDFKKQRIYSRPYFEIDKLISDSNTVIITEEIYISNFNTLLKKINN